MDVMGLPWPFVFTNYLEHIIESNNTQEEIYSLAIDICYPEKSVDEEQEVSAWHKRIEREEQAKRDAKENPPIEEEKPQAENPHIEEPEINMGEGSFSHLEDEMEEDE